MTKYSKNINNICENAIQMHFRYPDTFQLPTTCDIDSAPYVKICVDNERFWIKVTSKNMAQRIVIGTVANDLITDVLKYGDIVKFDYDKVYSVMDD